MKEFYQEHKIEKPASMEQQFTDRVYYVFSPEDETVLVGMDVRLEKNQLTWFDTVKERSMTVTRTDQSEKGISVTVAQEDGTERIYLFTPLTLELYTEKVKKGLTSPKDFGDIESLYRAFEETRRDAW